MPKTKENKTGVDSWTNNGHGIKSAPVSAERKKAIAEVQREIDAQKKGNGGKTPAKKK